MSQRSDDFNLSGTMERASLSRRHLVKGAAAAGLAAPAIGAFLTGKGFAQNGTPNPLEGWDGDLVEIDKSTDLIVQGSTTFETPLELHDNFLTPNELFFIRSNGPVAVEIAPEDWSLTVTGLVDQELELNLEDLQGMDVKTITTWVECSGNSRSRFDTVQGQEASGTQWGNGAIGNVEWTGVSVADILNEAGVQEGAVDMVSQGADFEDMQRGLPMETAMNGDVMLVWEMNGEPLPLANGGPVRLLVPGWGGIASTKWVVELDIIDHPFAGTFNSESYVVIDEDDNVVRPWTVQPVKSAIARPTPEETISAGEHTLSGFAWSGYGGITQVEVSTDGGETWEEADIVEEAGRLSWIRFEYTFNAEAGDEVVLASRATDERLNTQPNEVPWNALGYGMNAVYHVPVTVE